MIKKLSLILLMLGLAYNAYANVRNIQDNHQVIYHIIDGDGDHVGGETITLAIMKVSNSQWYDFNDDSFKASGWTNKTTNLSEDSTNGFYYYNFNPPVSETDAEQYIFLVDNGSATYGDHQSEIVSYQDIGTSTAADVWNVATRQLTHFDEDVTTIDIDATTIGTVSNVSDKTGYSLSAIGIDAIWDELQTGHTTAGTFGVNLDATISSRAQPSDVEIYVGQ